MLCHPDTCLPCLERSFLNVFWAPTDGIQAGQRDGVTGQPVCQGCHGQGTNQRLGIRVYVVARQLRTLTLSLGPRYQHPLLQEEVRGSMWSRPGELCALGPCGGLWERPGSQLYFMLLRLAFEIKGSIVYQQVLKNF